VRGTLGVFEQAFGIRLGPEGCLDAEVEALIEKRQAARAARDWAGADAIRKELAERGILLEDTPQGIRWKRKGS